MARVPGPGKRTIFTEIPDVVDTGAGSVFASIANGLAAASKVVQPFAEQEAMAQGVEAVSRGPDGRLQADTRIPFTQLDQLYNETAKSIYMTELDGEVATRITALAHQHQDDPSSFQQAARTYMTNLQREAPAQFRGDVALLAGSRINRVHSALVGDFYERQTARAYSSNQAATERLSREMVDYAAHPTDANKVRMGEVRNDLLALLTSRENLPGSTWTAEDTAAELDRFDRQAASSMDTALGQMTDAAVEIIRAGETPSNLHDVRATVAGTSYESTLAVAEEAAALAPGFAKMTPADQMALLQGYTQNGVDPDQLEAVEMLRGIHKDTLDAIAADPIAHAMKVSPEAFAGPLDMSSPASVQARLQAVSAIGAEGMNPTNRLFTNDELEQYTDMLRSKDPVQIAQVIQGAASFGQGAWKGAVEQLGLDPAQTHLVALQHFGAPDTTISQAISGMSISRPQRPQAGYKFSKQETVLEPYVTAIEVFGGVNPTFTAQNQAAMENIVSTAEYIFAAEMETRGFDAKDGYAPKVWEESLQKALGGSAVGGGQHEINGYDVILPPSISAQSIKSGFEQMERAYDLTPRFPNPELLAQSGDLGAFRSQDLARQLHEDKIEAFSEAEVQSVREAKEFWYRVSLNSSNPDFSPIKEDENGETTFDFSDLRILPVNTDHAVFIVQRGGQWAFIRDQGGDQAFYFSLSALAREGTVQ